MTCIAWESVIGIFKDIVVMIAAITGAIVAWRGLNTWNRQLKGGAEYELARRVLRCTYRLREAIKRVRSPVMWGFEMPSPPEEEARSMNPERRRYYGIARAYQQRWDKAAEARLDLDTELLEAEALWGKEISVRFARIFALQQELFATIHIHLSSINPDEATHMRESITREHRDVLYDLSGDAPDDFARRVAEAIAAVEALLKPHLKK